MTYHVDDRLRWPSGEIRTVHKIEKQYLVTRGKDDAKVLIRPDIADEYLTNLTRSS